MGKMELGIQKVEDLVDFLDKELVLGQEVEYQITGGKVINGQECIELTKDNEEPKMLGLNRKIKVELNKRFGEDPVQWLGNYITFRFIEYKPKPGQKNMSEGVTAEIVPDNTMSSVDIEAKNPDFEMPLKVPKVN